MPETRVPRKLAAILAADVVGYSHLMELDEAGTLAALKAHREELIDPVIAEHQGRIVKLIGDGALVEFASVVDALACAVEIQRGMQKRNHNVPVEQRIEFRMGINLGDVIVEGDDIYGEGVNVAARLESLAEPGGICITGNVFEQVETKMDVGYVDLGEQQVKNIARPVRAFKIVATPEAARQVIHKKQRPWPWGGVAASLAIVIAVAGILWWQQQPVEEPGTITAETLPFPKEPSIVVLPFEDLSSPSGQVSLADAITETITATFGQVPGLFVISRNSAFTYKNQPVKAKQVSQELGVRYVLEGSVQRADDRVRVTAQLVDATTDKHLWAERYDRDVGNVFALQDEIALRVLVALQVELTEGEQANLRSHPTNNVEAYLLYVRAMTAFRTFSKEGMKDARQLIRQSLKLDPKYSSVLILDAWTHIIDARFLYSPSREESLATASRLLEQVENLGKTLPNHVNAELLMARAFIDIIRGDHQRALALGSQALSLAPNNSFIVAVQGMILFFVRRYDESLRLFEKAMRLSPAYPSWYRVWPSAAYVFKGDHERAIALVQEGVAEAESDFMRGAHHVRAAFAFADRGDIDRAKKHVEQIRQLAPYLTLEFYRALMHFEHEADWERFATALRAAGLSERPAAKIPVKPSIAVLPFANISGDPEQEYFADGMTDDLITDLSKLSGLFVIARNSAYAYKGQSPDVRQVAGDLGVKYVLEGSARRAGDKVRINAQLIDATTGGHVWAERYDRKMTDIFDLQDEVIQHIVTALAVTLTPKESESLTHRSTKNATAYDYFLRGQALARTAQYQEARVAYEQAVAIDPGFARAYGSLSLTYTFGVQDGWSTHTQSDMEQALALTKKAIAIDENIPQIHFALSFAYLINRDHRLAIDAARRALELDPGYADAIGLLAWIHSHVGEPQEALRVLEKIKRLSPHLNAGTLGVFGLAYFLAGDFDKSIEIFQAARDSNPEALANRMYLAAALSRSGQEDEAEWEAAEILMLNPDLSANRWVRTQPHKDSNQLSRLRDDLRRAGFPE